jgi:hypothetical protein
VASQMGDFIPGPILSSQHEDEIWSGSKAESNAHALGSVLSVLACHPREACWRGDDCLTVKGILWIPKKAQHDLDHNC